MAQEQPRRGADEPAIQYGHVFAMTGDLAVQPIAPRDAAAMRSAEESVPGGIGSGGGGFSAAVAMETAEAYNQAVGAVHPGQASDAAAEHGVAVTQTAVPGVRVVTEFVAGQVVGRYSMADDDEPMEQEDAAATSKSKITIGEALEAAALSGEDRPIDVADAAAIQAAETQARGANTAMAGGLADQARAAARANTRARTDDDKIKIGDLLSDATTKLGGDKAVGMEDAARVVHAEAYRSAGARAKDGGVGATVVTAARLHEEDDDDDAM